MISSESNPKSGSQTVTLSTSFGSRKNYGKATELLTSVRELLVRNMTDEDRVKELESRGFQISIRTLRRIKAWIKKTPQQRLDYIAHTEFVQFHINAIDEMQYVNEKCKKLLESDNPILVLKAASEVRENLKVLASIYDSNPIVRAIAKKMEVAKVVQ